MNKTEPQSLSFAVAMQTIKANLVLSAILVTGLAVPFIGNILASIQIGEFPLTLGLEGAEGNLAAALAHCLLSPPSRQAESRQSQTDNRQRRRFGDLIAHRLYRKNLKLETSRKTIAETQGNFAKTTEVHEEI